VRIPAITGGNGAAPETAAPDSLPAESLLRHEPATKCSAPSYSQAKGCVLKAIEAEYSTAEGEQKRITAEDLSEKTSHWHLGPHIEVLRLVRHLLRQSYPNASFQNVHLQSPFLFRASIARSDVIFQAAEP
jgi:hypothetical protein